MVRTRFAPSPTGYLHIGGARTALYAWLYAQKMKGQFILRIEDTDLERSTQESVQAILDGMDWLRLNYNEGPFYQHKRFDRYQTVTQQLIDEGKAYRCYCSKERLETVRAAQIANKEKPRYDGHCLQHADLKAGTFVVRFKNPKEGVVQFDDLVHGPLSFKNTELDDLVIARSDGVPTYNFSVVIDDWDMRITHVIRGDDHINNTPRQLNIFLALGATPPQYAHVSMILGDDGKRLSKRHGAVSVLQYREEGYLSEALLNYLVRLGWSHGDQEIFSVDELIKYFDIKDINKAPAAFNSEKLLWLNQHYIKTCNADYLVSELKWQFEKMGVSVEHGPTLYAVLNAQRERAKTLHEMALKSRFFYEDPVITDAMLQQITSEIKPFLMMIRDRFLAISVWEKTAIHAVLTEITEANHLKLGKLAQPIRLLVTGGTISPPIDLTLELLGKLRVIARLSAVL